MKKTLSLAFVFLFITGCVTSEDLDKAYQKGFDEGYQEGVEVGELEGYEKGKKAEKNSFENRSFTLEQNRYCAALKNEIENHILEFWGDGIYETKVGEVFYSPKVKECVFVLDLINEHLINRQIVSNSDRDGRAYEGCFRASTKCLFGLMEDDDKEYCEIKEKDHCDQFDKIMEEYKNDVN